MITEINSTEPALKSTRKLREWWNLLSKWIASRIVVKFLSLSENDLSIQNTENWKYRKLYKSNLSVAAGSYGIVNWHHEAIATGEINK
ncbi:hypothetical protein SDJN03_22067, partial [Cucurbita argyrosperma subsp. sororia]